MRNELLPCPFCGSHDVEIQGKPAILDALDAVFCNECSADAPYPVWNIRAAQKAECPKCFGLTGCPNCAPKDEAIHPLQQCIRDNGEKIAQAVTEAQFREVLAVNDTLRKQRCALAAALWDVANASSSSRLRRVAKEALTRAGEVAL